MNRLGDESFVISKAIDEELLDVVKQLIALEDHLTTDGVASTDIQYQKQKDSVRKIRKRMMRMLLHAPEVPPPIEIRVKLASIDCCIKHMCLIYVIHTEICDLLSRVGKDEDVVVLLGHAKSINNMIHDYVNRARKILESKNNQTEVK